MSTPDLLPCPFCGDADIVLETSGEACRYQCNECGAITDAWFKGPRATIGAATAWNRRPRITEAEAREAFEAWFFAHKDSTPTRYECWLAALRWAGKIEDKP